MTAEPTTKTLTAAQVVARIEKLPSLPQAMASIVSQIDSRRGNAATVARAIETSPPLAASVIRVANSCTYACRRRVSSVADAVARIGMQEAKCIVSAAALYAARMGAAPCLAPFYAHSLLCALISNPIVEMSAALRHGHRGNPYFSAMLLHDIGLLTLHSFEPDAFLAALRQASEERKPMEAAERTTIGHAHTEVGMYLLMRWRLPANEPDVARWHHEPENAPPTSRLAAHLAHLCDLLSCEVLGYPELEVLAPELCAQTLPVLGLDEAKLAVLQNKAAELAERGRELARALFFSR